MSDTPRTDDAYYPTGLIAGDGFGNCKKTLRSVIYESRKLEAELAAKDELLRKVLSVAYQTKEINRHPMMCLKEIRGMIEAKLEESR